MNRINDFRIFIATIIQKLSSENLDQKRIYPFSYTIPVPPDG